MNCKKSILQYKYNRFLFAYFTIIIIKNDRILLYFKKSESEVNVCLRKKKGKNSLLSVKTCTRSYFYPVARSLTNPVEKFFSRSWTGRDNSTVLSDLPFSTGKEHSNFQRRAGFRDREPVLFLFVTRNNHLFHPGIHNFLFYRVPSYCTKILLTL